MSDYGLTDKGLNVPTYQDVLDQMIASYEADTGTTVDRSPDSALFQIFAVHAARYEEQWEGLQAIYDGQDPDTATGHQLDRICAITGIRRIPAAYSTVELLLTGDPGVTVPAGKWAEDTNRQRWQLTEDATFDAGGEATVTARADKTGPITAEAGTVTIIVTPVAGWTDVTNPAAASKGRDQETDAELRQRRQLSLQVLGRGSLKAIRAKLLELDFIDAAVVLENDTPVDQVIDGIGTVPPHSVVPVIYSEQPPDAQKRREIAKVLYSNVVAGVRCYGIDVDATVIADDGIPKQIGWSYATNVDVSVTVQVDGVDPSSVEEEIQTEVQDYFGSLAVGDAVRRLAILGRVATIDGIEAAEVLLNGSSADVEMSEIQVAILVTPVTVGAL